MSKNNGVKKNDVTSVVSNVVQEPEDVIGEYDNLWYCGKVELFILFALA